MEDSVYIQGARVVSDGSVFRADITIERGLITRVGVRVGHNWPPAEPEQDGHPESEKNRQSGRMNMADIPAGMVSGGPLLRSGRLMPRPRYALARATVGTASTESVSQLRPRKLGPLMTKTDALSKILSSAHSSAPSPVKNSFHPLTSVLEVSTIEFGPSFS
jgi:hypothetical protein